MPRKPDFPLGVANIRPILPPTLTLLLQRLHIGFHAPTIQAEPPLHITDIEPILLPQHQPLNHKVKPIKMPPGVAINPHKQVVLVTVNLI